MGADEIPRRLVGVLRAGIVLIDSSQGLQFRMAVYADLAGNAVIAKARKATLRYWMSAIGTTEATRQDGRGNSESYDSDEIS